MRFTHLYAVTEICWKRVSPTTPSEGSTSAETHSIARVSSIRDDDSILRNLALSRDGGPIGGSRRRRRDDHRPVAASRWPSKAISAAATPTHQEDNIATRWKATETRSAPPGLLCACDIAVVRNLPLCGAGRCRMGIFAAVLPSIGSIGPFNLSRRHSVPSQPNAWRLDFCAGSPGCQE